MTVIASHGSGPRARRMSELLSSLGDVPAERVLLDPPPGTATEQDLLDYLDHEGRPCELVYGTLVEKAVGLLESILAAALIRLLGNFVSQRKLGLLSGEQGPYRLALGLVRLPDVAYIPWSRLPARVEEMEPIPSVVPALAAEIVSHSNTPRELELKRREYFKAGVELVWIIDPGPGTLSVYTSDSAEPDAVLKSGDVLTGGRVLPGWELPVSHLFAETQRPPGSPAAGQHE